MKWENEKTHQSLTPSVPQSRTSALDIDHLTPRCHHIFPPVPVTCLLHQTHLTLIPHFRFLGHFCLLSAISSWLQGAQGFKIPHLKKAPSQVHAYGSTMSICIQQKLQVCTIWDYKSPNRYGVTFEYRYKCSSAFSHWFGLKARNCAH